MSKEKKDTRTRNWSFIVYPFEVEENTPKNWKIILQETNAMIGISPIHDLDINEGTGELKKAHHHILIMFEGKKSYEQIKEICDSVNATIPQICHSAKGLMRYFSHKDNPEKIQYKESDIICLNGLDIDSILTQTATEKKRIIKEICEYIILADIREYSDLIEYAMYNNDEWFDLLTGNFTIFLTQFIRSRKFRGTVKSNIDCE